jgi:hypothetical protein
VRSRLAILLLAIFVAADVLLVTLAFRHTAAPPPASAETSGRQSPSPASPRAGASSDPSSTPDGSAVVGEQPLPAYVDVDAEGTVLRASRGACDGTGAAVVTVSTNLGKTFRKRDLDGLAEVLRAETTTDSGLLVVGRDEACELSRWTSQDNGRTWAREAGAGGAWYLAPSARRQVVFSPAGRQRTPCVPVALSTMGSDVVRILCEDGQVQGTSDEGESWVTLGRLEGAVSIAFSTPGDGVALAEQDGCPAAVMETSDGGTDWTQQTCLDGDEPLAVALGADVSVAQVDDQLYVSADGGEDWSPAGR